MDSLREKAIKAIEETIKHPIKGREYDQAVILLDCILLDAYFREKHKAEPSGVVERKEVRKIKCPFEYCITGTHLCEECGCVKWENQTISRKLSKEELIEWAKETLGELTAKESVYYEPDLAKLPSGGGMSYPDIALIKRLTQKFLTTSVKSLTQDETIDLINHLREYASEQSSLLRETREALKTIASYGKDGICLYGCDTPYIAQQALDRLKGEATS